MNMERVVYPECVYVYDERITLCIIFVSILCCALTAVGILYQQTTNKVETRLSGSYRSSQSVALPQHKLVVSRSSETRYRQQKAVSRTAEASLSASPQV